MMKDRFGTPLAVSAMVAAMFIGAVGCCPSHHHHHDEEKDEHEEKIDAAQLPEPVKASIAREMPTGQITEAEKEDEDGKSVYEVDVKVGEKVYEVKATADGKILSSKEDKYDEDEKK